MSDEHVPSDEAPIFSGGAWPVGPAPATLDARVRGAMAQAAGRPRHHRRHWIVRWQGLVGATVILIVGGLVIARQVRRPTPPDPVSPTRAARSAAPIAGPRVDLGISADGASIVLVLFVDYECP